MAIHFNFNNNKTENNTTSLATYERVEAEVVSVPKAMPIPTLTQKPTVRHTYTHSTLFEGNGRTLLWEGLGSDVSEANSAMEVCRIAGLDYVVKTEPMFTSDGLKIPHMICTRRYDNGIAGTVYGAVTERYHPIQNHKGFEFIDAMFGHNGFQVETAGQFNDGKIVWVEAKLPERVLVGENLCPYLVFTNRHDGKGSVRIFLTPVRVVCKNTLNYAIKGAKGRAFSVQHTRNADWKLEQAKETIENYNSYLGLMGDTIAKQKQILLEDHHVDNFLDLLFKVNKEATQRQKDKAEMQKQEVRHIYRTAKDLDGYEMSAFRFVNAVSDWATHNTSHRQTANYRDNLFQKTIEGNEFIDRAVEIVEEFAPVSNKLITM